MNRPASLRCAAIDVGSHSVKLTIARRSPDGWRPERDLVEVTGLGRGEPRRDGLDPEARRRTVAVLAGFADLLRDAAVTAVAVTGTAVLRNAPDAPAFVAEVRERTGLLLEVISGAEEARLTYLGAVAALPAAASGSGRLVFDIGGASTELAWGRGLEPEGRQSLDLGTIALAQRFGLADAAPIARVEDAVAEFGALLDALGEVPPAAGLVGIGATPATLLALDRGRDIADGAEVHGQPLPRPLIAHQIERLRRLDAAERRQLPGLHPGRAEVVLAGAAICAAVTAHWSELPVVISAHGLRSGLLRDRFGSGR